MLSLHEEAADVGESSGAAGSDAVGSQRDEEFTKHVVDINLGDEIARGRSEFVGEIIFAGLGSGAGAVGEAESVMLGMSGESTEASIGEFILAKVEDIGWSRV